MNTKLYYTLFGLVVVVFLTQFLTIRIEPNENLKKMLNKTLAVADPSKYFTLAVPKREFNFSKETKWKNLAEYKFSLQDGKQLPSTENVIIHVMITGKPNFWFTQFTDKNLDQMSEPLCRSAKHFGEGLITLISSPSNATLCGSWKDGLVVRFDSLLSNVIPIHDERLFVVEQFIRQFGLWKKYK